MNITASTTLNPRRHAAGFTLIELMVTVAIVAILTTIAYPSYVNYVRRGQIVSATNALSAASANMERVFQDNRTYVAPAGYVGSPCVTPPAAGTFTVTCSNLTGTTYTLTATGSGTTAGFTYTIDQTGTQTTTVGGLAPASWVPPGGFCPASWLTKAAQC